MRQIRLKLNLSTVELARALGYAGKATSLDLQIRRYENEGRTISPGIARLVLMFDAYGVPPRWVMAR